MSVNCLIETKVYKKLADRIKAKYPDKSYDRIKAEITAAADKLNTPEVPTFEQMEDYYKGKTKQQKPLGVQNELDKIKSTAITNGTFMKAPNGRPTNLTENQLWSQGDFDEDDAIRFLNEAYSKAPVNSYSGNITPDINTIFVFGSNPQGRHSAGAAKVAREKFGAIYGQGEGLQGNAYALPTKDLRVRENNSLRSIPEGQIIESIKKLYDVARQNPSKQFKIAYRNTTTASLNGYTGLEMIDMFLKAGSIPSNIMFSKEWVDTGKFDLPKGVIEDVYTKTFGTPRTEVNRSTESTKPSYNPLAADNLIDRSKLDEISLRSFKNTQQRMDRVNLISRMFSDITSEFIEEEGFTGKRSAFFTKDNVLRVFKEVKDTFNPDLVNEEDYGSDWEYIKSEFEKIQENWESLVEDAFNILWTTEGISKNGTITFDEGDETSSKDDNMTDGDSPYAGKDGWMIKAREIDLRDTLSQSTRRILGTIQKVTRNGEIDVDDLGYARYLNPDYTHLTLLEAVSKIWKASQFDKCLENLSIKHPWVTEVVERINEDPSTKAKFYHDLRKEFVPYWIQIGDKTKQVNRTSDIYYLLTAWRNNYESGNILHKDSVYNKKNEINTDNAKTVFSKIVEMQNQYLISPEKNFFIEENIEDILGFFLSLGIEFSEDELYNSLTANEDFFSSVMGNLSAIYSKIAKGELSDGKDMINHFSNYFEEIANVMNYIPDGVTITSFREAGKSYQSYSAPSYIGKFTAAIHSDTALQFLEEEFADVPMFYSKKTGYRGDWLKKLASNPKYRDMFERKVVLHANKREFNDWDEGTYLDVIVREYFSTLTDDTAMYALPLLADAPSAEFIKFVRYRDYSENIDGRPAVFEEIICDKLTDVVLQEYERICVVLERDTQRRNGITISPIANFDIQRDNSGEILNVVTDSNGNIISRNDGAEFKFFPALNTLRESDGREYIVDGENVDFFTYLQYMRSTNPQGVRRFVRNTLLEIQEREFNNFMSQSDFSIPDANLYETQEDVLRAKKEFFYNNALAYTQMVQLFTTDLAYYKNLNDFQKRFKEVYAMTNKLYTMHPEGKQKERVVYLSDVEIQSNIYDSVKNILDNTKLSKLEKDYILSQYKKVNVTDAQAFRTLKSYKQVMQMSGNWTDEMNSAYERLEKGEFDAADFEVIWQTIKPFVFTQTKVDARINNASGANYGNLKVPVQHKNSEYLLLALYSTIAKGVGNSTVITTLNKWMDKNDIDVVMFESAVKAGCQGTINLNGLTDKKSIEVELNKALDPANDAIHEIDYEDWGIQTATPEHLLDHNDIIGSQFKKLIVANLPDDPNITYKVGDKEMNKQQLYDTYQEVMTANILDSYKECVDIFASIENVAAAIQKEMNGNSRYTDEERKACTLVERNGKKVFNIPLYDPIQTDRIEQLLNSIIKKKVTKQSIRRAASIQVSSFGYTDELNIRFSDENGDFIFNENEWNGKEKVQKSQRKLLREKKNQYKTYQEYREASKDSAIAYWECYMPAYSRQFFEALGNADGNFNINSLPEELRKCIGLRVPTEAKYSMQPLYIKGFLPQQNGSAIMLPADVTTVVGSDFDVDKVFIMFYEFIMGDISRSEYNKLSESERERWESLNDIPTFLDEMFESEGLMSDSSGYKNWLSYQKENNPDYYKVITKKTKPRKIKYNYSNKASQQSDNPSFARKMRNNAMLDIAWGVLTNHSSVKQMITPGGFEEAKRVANIANILKNMPIIMDNDTLQKIKSLSRTEAKKMAKIYTKALNPLSPLTQTYFHGQNANGGKMIGVYAVGSASHAITQWSDTRLNTPLQFLDKTYQNLNLMTNKEDELLSENVANFLAASVDNVKEPVLKSLNQDSNTGDKMNLLLRLGVPINEAGLFMCVPIISDATYIELSSQGYKAKESLTLEEIMWAINIANNIDIRLLGSQLTDEQLKDMGISHNRYATFVSIMMTISNINNTIQRHADSLTQLTQASRGDSMNAAAGPSIGHNLYRMMQLDKLRQDIITGDNTIDSNLLPLDFLLDSNFDTSYVEDWALHSSVPFLTAATKLGVLGPNKLFGYLYPQLNSRVLGLLYGYSDSLLNQIDISRISKDKAASIINNFFKDFFLYTLRGTKFFGGDNPKAEMNYFIIKFPSDFASITSKYANDESVRNNSFINSITVAAANKYSKFSRLVFSNTGNLSKFQKGNITKDWAELLANPNKELSDLAYNMFKYGMLSGLGYTGPNSFIHLAPNILRLSIPEYFSSMEGLMSGNGQFYQFIEQYMRNDITTYAKYVHKPKVLENGDIEVNGQKCLKKVISELLTNNGKPNFIHAKLVWTKEDDKVKYYSLKNVSFNLDGNAIVTYTPTTPLGIPNKVKEYYYGVNSPQSAIAEELKKEAERQSNIDSSNEYSSFSPYGDNDFTEEELEFSIPNADAEPIKEVLDDENNPICYNVEVSL